MILRDPVHELIAFEREEELVAVRLLETREVQRLRRIRQLGLTSFAYPGAEHTRFAHALGAAHVMQRFIERVRRIDGDLPFWQRLTSERARDAIAAALLHDVGHGPLSHLFEDAMPGALPHESWTEAILLDPGSEVHRVLAADDAGLPERVAALIRGEHDLPYLAKAVSGTFDVDRCDYLLRDAHATGVRHGDFDLPWLLRSLCLGGRPRAEGEAPGLAIDGQKGLAAIESFVLARHFMFQQVYFHKSTRAAEFMIGALLRRAVSLARQGEKLPAMPAAFARAAAGERPSLGEYLELDDIVLFSVFRAWEEARDPVLADLARRVRARSLFKAIEILPERMGEREGSERRARDEAEPALARAREIAAEAGLDPEVYVGVDIAADVPYAEDDSLAVVFRAGRPRLPSEVSFLLDRLKNASVTRVRVIFAGELAGSMREALVP